MCQTETLSTISDECDKVDYEDDLNKDEVDKADKAEDLPECGHNYGRRGNALIFTFTKYAKYPHAGRKGADTEAQNFENLLECLGFDVELHPNKTTEEVKEIIKSGKFGFII